MSDLLQGSGEKLVIVAVGLPARGKTFLSHKLHRYLAWLGYRVKLIRQSGKDEIKQTDADSKSSGEEFPGAQKEIRGARAFLLEEQGNICILDGCHGSRAERRFIADELRGMSDSGGVVIRLLWVEMLTKKKSIVDFNLLLDLEDVKEHQNTTLEEAMELFRTRLAKLSIDYLSLSDAELGDHESIVKIIDAGRRVDSFRIDGYLRAKIVFFLMNLSIKPNPIYLSRHGQSEYNLRHLLGGDSSLTEDGVLYAEKLSDYVGKEPEIVNHEKGDFHVFCTTLVRTQQTAFRTCEANPRAVTTIWKNLAEIDAGICEGMTYEEVEEKYPDIAVARKADKLTYRYPQGESYLDLIKRLEPVIIELERIQRPILVIAHQAVLRCLYAYFFDLRAEQVPYLSIPLHTVIKLLPTATGCNETRTELGPTVSQ